MNINWEFVKRRTLWEYEVLIQTLYQSLSYEFVQQHYNHSMDEAIDYVNEIHAGYLQHRGDDTWVDDLVLNFTWLKRAGVQSYLDLIQQVDTKEKCEAFLKKSGMGFHELIETLNYLFRWVLPFPVPLRELIEPEDATQKAYLQALKQQGITTNLDLLEQGRTAAQREPLAALTQIPLDFLFALIHRADLARLAYVRGKIVRHLCSGGYESLARLATADPQEIEAALNIYFHKMGKQFADYKSVLPLAYLVGGARILPAIIETQDPPAIEKEGALRQERSVPGENFHSPI